MRLSEREVKTIVKAVTSHFHSDAAVFLFGSRVNDATRGGDIDLFVDLPEVDRDVVRHTCQTIATIQLALGEQKIDLIVRHPGSTDRPIFHDALKHGELLA